MLKETRRLISAIENNQSKLVSEDTVKALIPYDVFPSFQLQNLFYTEDNPQSLDTRHKDVPYDIDLPAGATRFMKLRMPTKAEMTADLEKAGEPIPEDWSKFNLHNTDSVDYIYVLDGQITHVVGEEKIELQQGDFVAQVGPEHTWINDHDKPCYILCVMIGIEPENKRKRMTAE